jgi:hypothetical protein
VPRSVRRRVSLSRAPSASASATGSLGDPALDSEPRSAPWRGETAGGAGKDAPPGLRAARAGKRGGCSPGRVTAPRFGGNGVRRQGCRSEVQLATGCRAGCRGGAQLATGLRGGVAATWFGGRGVPRQACWIPGAVVAGYGRRLPGWARWPRVRVGCCGLVRWPRGVRQARWQLGAGVVPGWARWSRGAERGCWGQVRLVGLKRLVCSWRWLRCDQFADAAVAVVVARSWSQGAGGCGRVESPVWSGVLVGAGGLRAGWGVIGG